MLWWNKVITVLYIETKNCNYADKNNICDEVITLTIEENAWLNRKISFYSRGIYDLGTISIKAYDIFRIISFYKKQDLNIKLKVYPKIYDIKKLPGGGKDLFINTLDKTVSNEDQFTIKDVRKYRTGDSLKRVHWKLSAKHNELYVKNSDTTSGEEIAILMDMKKENYDYDSFGKAEEAVVDFSMSIVNYIVRREINMNTNIFMNSNKITSFQVRDKEEFNSLMELMVNLKSDGLMDLESFIQEQCYKLHKVNQIITIIAKLTISFTNSVIGLKSQGYNISVFFYLEDSEAEQCEIMLRKWGINCLNIVNMCKISEVEG
jgi:uncharacterized protein (DUF58 family)